MVVIHGPTDCLPSTVPLPVQMPVQYEGVGFMTTYRKSFCENRRGPYRENHFSYTTLFCTRKSVLRKEGNFTFCACTVLRFSVRRGSHLHRGRNRRDLLLSCSYSTRNWTLRVVPRLLRIVGETGPRPKR